MKTAKLRSDYSTDTWLRITQSDDGDISLKIIGDGEMRITTSGSRLKGQDLLDVIEAFITVIDISNRQEIK